MRGVRGGSNFNNYFLVDEGEETINGSPSGRCRTNIECWLRTFVAFLIFRDPDQYCFGNPIFFFFKGGGGGGPDPLSPLCIRLWRCSIVKNVFECRLSEVGWSLYWKI